VASRSAQKPSGQGCKKREEGGEREGAVMEGARLGINVVGFFIRRGY
jgi:hypothetical protein